MAEERGGGPEYQGGCGPCYGCYPGGWPGELRLPLHGAVAALGFPATWSMRVVRWPVVGCSLVGRRSSGPVSPLWCHRRSSAGVGPAVAFTCGGIAFGEWLVPPTVPFWFTVATRIVPLGISMVHSNVPSASQVARTAALSSPAACSIRDTRCIPVVVGGPLSVPCRYAARGSVYSPADRWVSLAGTGWLLKGCPAPEGFFSRLSPGGFRSCGYGVFVGPESPGHCRCPLWVEYHVAEGDVGWVGALGCGHSLECSPGAFGPGCDSVSLDPEGHIGGGYHGQAVAPAVCELGQRCFLLKQV